MTDDAVVGTDVELRYGDLVAVAESSFRIRAGSRVSMIGPNGSGKSTLLAGLAGLHEPSAGEIEVLGTSPSRARRRVALVPQSTNVSDVLPVTVREVVMMGRYPSLGFTSRFGSEDRRSVDAAIQCLQLEGLVHHHLGELSGGQRQRVFVAQGLAQDRDILLLDEPTTALDLVSTQIVESVITDERASGRTVVITTHSLSEAALSDHVILLAGRVVAEGPPESVLTPDILSEAYATRIVDLEGSLLVDDPAHRIAEPPHTHIDRASGTHAHRSQ